MHKAHTKIIELRLRNMDATVRLAEILAELLQAGDMVYLCGALGSGKTYLARHVIQTLAREAITVPSPSFTLVQDYRIARADEPEIVVRHADLYRIAAPDEVEELGLIGVEDAAPITFVEWPENGDGVLPAPDITIEFNALADDADAREVACVFHDAADERAEKLSAAWVRAQEAAQFVAGAGWAEAARQVIAGDASTRRYARLTKKTQSAVLMDWPSGADGPPIRDGKPYSQLVHLAEAAPQFCRINEWLRAQDLVAPEILAQDKERGLILLEDFGDATLAQMVATDDANVAAFYFEAVETLLHLHAQTPPRDLPAYDRIPLTIETELFLDWFCPAHGVDIDDAARGEWVALWHGLAAKLEEENPVCVLRDYHSPNLLWLAGRQQRWRVGLIDVQDAVRGAAAYDLISLLDDARVDVSPARRAMLLEHYIARRFGDDTARREAFMAACAVVQAQRNLKIAGIFERLDKRDGKPGYRRHLPRILGYIRAALTHAELRGLSDWFERNAAGVLDD